MQIVNNFARGLYSPYALQLQTANKLKTKNGLHTFRKV